MIIFFLFFFGYNSKTFLADTVSSNLTISKRLLLEICSPTFSLTVEISPGFRQNQMFLRSVLSFFFFLPLPFSFPVKMKTKIWIGTARRRFSSQYQTIKCTSYREKTRASRMRKFSSYSKYVLATKIGHARSFLFFLPL